VHSACLFCHQSLGANESIEHSPVGQHQALENEIALLEEAWRQAEEIAAIADKLLTAPSTDQFIRDHEPNR
jgi:hypothetical protein